MTPEQASVAEANDAFYQALSDGDMEAMSEIWFPADWAECVHPGWTALYGWEAIRESWRLILGGGGRLHVTAMDPRVRLVGDVAWVSCAERITATDGDEIHTSAAQAFNLFVRHDGRWRLAVHHAAAVPFVTPPAPVSGERVN
jgi:uncharacterized protein (TIGR02246 family)